MGAGKDQGPPPFGNLSSSSKSSRARGPLENDCLALLRMCLGEKDHHYYYYRYCYCYSCYCFLFFIIIIVSRLPSDSPQTALKSTLDPVDLCLVCHTFLLLRAHHLS